MTMASLQNRCGTQRLEDPGLVVGGAALPAHCPRITAARPDAVRCECLIRAGGRALLLYGTRAKFKQGPALACIGNGRSRDAIHIGNHIESTIRQRAGRRLPVSVQLWKNNFPRIGVVVVVGDKAPNGHTQITKRVPILFLHNFIIITLKTRSKYLGPFCNSKPPSPATTWQRDEQEAHEHWHRRQLGEAGTRRKARIPTPLHQP